MQGVSRKEFTKWTHLVQEFRKWIDVVQEFGKWIDVVQEVVSIEPKA